MTKRLSWLERRGENSHPAQRPGLAGSLNCFNSVIDGSKAPRALEPQALKESHRPVLAARLSRVTWGNSLHFSHCLSFFVCEMDLVEQRTLWS